MRLVLLFFIFYSVSTLLYCQELKKRVSKKGEYVEEYFVTKEDKNVRQGQYYKFKKDLLDRNVLVEIGNYELNNKSGVWYTFFSHGSLKSYGPYVDNKKEGSWKEYYRLESSNSLSPFTGIQHSAQLNKDGNLEINEENLNISAKGTFKQGLKFGIWDYYSEHGDLVQRYDHTKDTLIEDAIVNSSQFYCPYLGGIVRFNRIYHDIDSEINFGKGMPTTDSEVIVTVNLKMNPYEFRINQQSGSLNFAKQVLDILEEMPLDWIPQLINNSENLVYVKAAFSNENRRFSLSVIQNK